MRSYPRIAFVNQFNYKNATAFFTNAFKRKAALNKWSLFSNFVLVIITLYIIILYIILYIIILYIIL